MVPGGIGGHHHREMTAPLSDTRATFLSQLTSNPKQVY